MTGKIEQKNEGLRADLSIPVAGYDIEEVVDFLSSDQVVELERLSETLGRCQDQLPVGTPREEPETEPMDSELYVNARQAADEIQHAKAMLFVDPANKESKQIVCDNVIAVRNAIFPMARKIRWAYGDTAFRMQDLADSVKQLETEEDLSPDNTDALHEQASKIGKNGLPSREFLQTALSFVEAERVAEKVHAFSDFMAANPSMVPEFKKRLESMKASDEPEYVLNNHLSQIVARAFVTKSRFTQHRPLPRIMRDSKAIEEANSYFERLDSKVDNLVGQVPALVAGRLYEIIATLRPEDTDRPQAVEAYLDGHLQSAGLLLQKLGIELPDEHKIDTAETVQEAA